MNLGLAGVMQYLCAPIIQFYGHKNRPSVDSALSLPGLRPLLDRNQGRALLQAVKCKGTALAAIPIEVKHTTTGKALLPTGRTMNGALHWPKFRER
jgi:hypothetical protein